MGHTLKTTLAAAESAIMAHRVIIKQQAARIAELEAALRTIANMTPRSHPSNSDINQALATVGDVARRALLGENDHDGN